MPSGDDAWLDNALARSTGNDALTAFPLVVVVDDSEFAARDLDNWLWVTFTRSNPAADVHGIEPFVEQKHWGCRGPLVIDARVKPHHAPPLESDPEVVRASKRWPSEAGRCTGCFDGAGGQWRGKRQKTARPLIRLAASPTSCERLSSRSPVREKGFYPHSHKLLDPGAGLCCRSTTGVGLDVALAEMIRRVGHVEVAV